MKKHRKLISFIIAFMSFGIVVFLNRFLINYVFKNFGINYRNAQFIGSLCLISFLLGAVMIFSINLIDKKFK
jgi:hypothetical protein